MSSAEVPVLSLDDPLVIVNLSQDIPFLHLAFQAGPALFEDAHLV